MKLGDKIIKLRKEKNLTQEDLANEIGVTRQTISNWELNETVPDLEQSKKLSNIFKVSLDELVDNDNKEILIEKVSHTEKLAKTLFIIILVIIFIAGIFLFEFVVQHTYYDIKTKKGVFLTCTMDSKEYKYSFSLDKNDKIVTNSSLFELPDEIIDKINSYEDISLIDNYYEQNNGKCTRIEHKYK